MAGKAPSRGRKDKAHNARPYDRPNQSILGKVASTVKGLFKPSLSFFIPSWAKSEEEEDCGSFDTNRTEADLTENEEEPEQSIRPRLPTRIKRARLEADGATESVQQAPYWLGPSTSRGNLPDGKIEPSNISSNCQIGRKESPVVINGDDHSENSDGSASTSGCSSLVSSQDKPHRSSGLKLSESALEHLRGNLKNKPAFQRPKKDASISTENFLGSPQNENQNDISLWSCGTQTPIKSPARSSLIHSSRPSFNVSSFGTPLKLNAPGSKISSPFYEGTTMFGGASAYRKNQQQQLTAPYQLNRPKPLKSQIKIKETNSSGEFQYMSTAAKRIYHTLEKMSTPVTDAKKIPNVNKLPIDIPLAITPPSQRLKSYLSLSRKSPAPSHKGPPIVNLNSISQLTLLKNHKTRFSRNAVMEFPLQEQPVVNLEEREPEPQPVLQVKEPHARAGGGKMRTDKRETLHAPSKAKSMQEEAEEEEEEEYELPNIPLPIKTLPVISFSSKPSSESRSIAETKKANERCELLSFTFSSPIEYSTPAEVPKPRKATDSPFKFSSPLVISSKHTSLSSSAEETPQNENGLMNTGSVDDVLKRFISESNQNVESGAKADRDDVPEAKQESKNGTSSGFGDKFLPKPGSWSCSACFLQNNKNDQKCIACETPKSSDASVSISKPSVSTATNSFKVHIPPGSWECPSCLIRNNQVVSKCLACETQKPKSSSAVSSGFGEKFKMKAGSWECSMCMVRNNEGDVKCAACETPNPNAPSISLSSSGIVKHNEANSDVSNKSSTSSENSKLFQSNAGTWECDTCLVRNTLDKTKCAACETLRPSKSSMTDSGSSFFKFGQSTQNFGAPTTFKFGSLVSSSVPTTVSSTFKFGMPADAAKSSSNATAAANCIFGVSEADKLNSVNVKAGAFKFGIPSDMAKSDAVTASANTYTFGVAKSTVDDSSVSAPETGVSFKTATASGAISEPEPNKKVENKIEIPQIRFGSDASASVSEENKQNTLIAPCIPELKPDGFKFQPPVLSVSTTSSEVFKPAAIFGSTSVGTGFKFGIQGSETKTTTSSASLFGGFSGIQAQSNLPIQTAAESTVTVSERSSLHSKPVAEKTEQPATSFSGEASSLVQSTEPVLPKPQNFSFGSPAAVPVTVGDKNDKRTFVSFGLFGNSSTSLQQQPSAFKLDEARVTTSAENSSSVFSSQGQPAPVASSGINTAFSFTPSPIFTGVTGQSTANQTEVKQNLPQPETSNLPRNPTSLTFTTSSVTPAFSFGSTSVASPISSTTSGFTMSSPATATPICVGDSMPKTPSLFTFGGPSKTDMKAPSAGFVFKRKNEENTAFVAPNKIGFGGLKADSTNSTGMSSMTAAAPFKFGTPAPSGFLFGAGAKTETTQSSGAQFSFGSGPPKPSSFVAFQPSQPAATSSMRVFSFGSSGATSTTAPSVFNSDSSAAFTFGGKSNQPAPLNPLPANPASVFGAPTAHPGFGSAAAAAPTFGSMAAPPSFGSISAPKPEASAGFNFGAAANTGINQQPVFVFGASAEKPAIMPAQGSGFRFGVAPQADSTNTFPASFSINTPPSFNFGATSTPRQPFQFVASSDVSGSSNTSSSQRRVRKAIRRSTRKTD